MKKFLSLVLALVMTMSLVTISAGAKDFTDDESITYAEAIDVMSAVKVVDGYPDGSFKPSNQLNRGQAAKILCNMLLGPTTASALKADAAPFKDVAVDNTFAGYIAYCAQAGIIDGYTDGTFRPTAPLTGYAFMKLLLGALGYDKDVEGYNVPNWSINVAKQALAIGLDAGLKSDFDGTKIVTREEACLYAFNALQADLVEYGSKTTVNVGGAEVVIAGTAAKAVTWNNSATKKTNIKDDNYVQFAEQYFNKLVKADVTDDFARPAVKWTNKGLKVGTYVDEADASYSKNVELGKIYGDLNMNQKDTAEVFVNGIQKADVVVSKNNTTKIASSSANKNLVDDGSIVEVFYDADTNDVRICVIDVYVGEITSVNKTAADPYVNLVGYSTGKTGSYKFETTDDFEEETIVLFTYSDQGNGSVQAVAKAESVEGTLAKVTYTKSVQLGETTYEYSKNMALAAALGSEANLNPKTDYVVYLDENGLAIYVEEQEFKATDYAFVLALDGASQAGFSFNRAKLVMADGTVKTVYTDEDYTTGTTLLGQIVNYRIDSNGNYVLRKAPNSTFNGTGNAAAALTSVNFNTDGLAKNGVSGTELVNGDTVDKFILKNSYAAVKPSSGTTVYANSETVFVVFDGTDYNVYTGIANAPTIKALKDSNGDGISDSPAVDQDVEMFYYTRSNNILAFAFIDATDATITDGSNSIVYLAGKESVSEMILDSDNKAYYTYNAVVGGEITTVKVAADATGLADTGADVNGVYQNPSYNNKNMIKSLTGVGGKYRVVELNTAGIWRLDGKYTVGLNSTTTAAASTRYTVAKNADIFRISTKGVITKIAVEEIYSDSNDTVIALLDTTTGDLAQIYIQDVENGKTENAPVVADLASFTAVKNGAGSAIDMTVTLTGKASAATNVTLTVYAMNGGTWVEMTSVTATVAKDATTSGTVTLSGLAAGQYKVTCGNLAPQFVVV